MQLPSGVSRSRCEEEGSPNDPYRPSNRRARATPRTPAAASLRGCRLSPRWLLPAGPAGPTADRGTQEGSRPKLGSSQGNNVESRSRRRSISSRALLIYTPRKSFALYSSRHRGGRLFRKDTQTDDSNHGAGFRLTFDARLVLIRPPGSNTTAGLQREQ